ncbi:hypothetical protein P7K49_010902, partial [Saguinus oedipus]
MDKSRCSSTPGHLIPPRRVTPPPWSRVLLPWHKNRESAEGVLPSQPQLQLHKGSGALYHQDSTSLPSQALFLPVGLLPQGPKLDVGKNHETTANLLLTHLSDHYPLQNRVGNISRKERAMQQYGQLSAAKTQSPASDSYTCDQDTKLGIK